jgi:hypothetical protein
MDRADRQRLIDRYVEGPAVLRAALDGITAAELDFRPGPGEWSAREVAHHMADSEMMSAMRLRRLLAEDNPVIQGYDEEEFARRLSYGERAIEPSLGAVTAARETTAQLLDHLTEEDWGRQGRHTEGGSYGVERWLEIYASHAHDHADQIRRCREGFRA